MRIALAQFHHESNMFTPLRTQVEDLHDYLWGDDVIRANDGLGTYLGGMIAEARMRGITVVPLFSALGGAGPMITAEAWVKISADFLAAFDQIQPGDVDAICIGLHGAAAAEQEIDPEGYLLTALRERYGRKMPIAATLDIHTNLSDRMVQAADGLFGSKEYPEIDSRERGREAIGFLAGMVSGTVDPVKAHRHLPLVPHGVKQYIGAEPAKSLMALCRQVEQKAPMLNCTVYFGYPDADVPFLGTHVLALANGDREVAERTAALISNHIWDRRFEFVGLPPTPEVCLQQAIDHPGSPVIIAESSDNPGGGSAGDATSLLRAMLDRAGEIGPATFASIADGETVATAHEARVGSIFRARIGGKSPDACSDPIEVDVTVKALRDGTFRLSGAFRTGMEQTFGRTALLDIRGVQVIIGEKPLQIFDEEPFRLFGIEPARCKVVGLKSTVHFRATYQPLGSLVLVAVGAGPFHPDAGRRVYKSLSKPLWKPD